VGTTVAVTGVVTGITGDGVVHPAIMTPAMISAQMITYFIWVMFGDGDILLFIYRVIPVLRLFTRAGILVFEDGSRIYRESPENGRFAAGFPVS
jgi:hypothetical protein